MKLKQFLAGVLTGVMVVASVPVSGLESVLTWAEETDSELPPPQTIEGAYHYHSIADGITATSDADFKNTDAVKLLTDSGNNVALSRYNTGGMPIGREINGKNNIYFKLPAAKNVSNLTWWTKNPIGRNYNNGANVEPGTLLRYKLWVTKETAADAGALQNMGKDKWIGGEVVEVELDKKEQDYSEEEKALKRLSHNVAIAEVLGKEAASGVTGIRLEVLNTAGEYRRESGTVKDHANEIVTGSGVEIFEQAAAAEETEGGAAAAGKIEGVTVAAEFATDDDSLEELVDDPSSNINNDQTLQGSGLPDNSMDAQMESTAGELQLEAGDGKLKANNNLYFKLPMTKNYQIGRLTYMAGTIYGSIAECNIYTSSDESVGYDSNKGPEYITDWEKVYSNVPGEQMGKTEYLDSDGDVAYLEGEDIEPWDAYVPNPAGWENAHVAVFDEVKNATFVRIEVIKTKNTESNPLSSLENKWISGKSVHIYEAVPAMNYGDVSRIDLNVAHPFMNTLLGRASVTNQTSAYMRGNSWVWKGEDGSVIQGEKTAYAQRQQYTIEISLTVPSGVQISDNLAVNMQLMNGDKPMGDALALPESEVLVERGVGNNPSMIKVTHTMPQVEDTRQAWQELKTYFENTAKAAYEQGNFWKPGEVLPDDKVVVDGTDSNHDLSLTPTALGAKYAARVYEDFKAHCITVENWTNMHSLPGFDANGNPVEGPSDGETAGPSGRHTIGEYVAAKEELERLFEGLPDAILYSRTAMEDNETLGVSVNRPEEGEVLGKAALTGKGSLESTNKDIVLQYRNGAEVREDGYIYGGGNGIAYADQSNSKNDIFKISNQEFMVYFKLKMDEAPTEKQSIVGSLNGGWGVQFVPVGTSVDLLAFGQNTSGLWPETKITLPANWFQEGVEHEIVIVYNNEKKFDLYADGVKATEKRGHTGPLKVSDENRFAIGYNPNTPDGNTAMQDRPGEFFTGGFKDFTMFIKKDENTVMPNYSALADLTGTAFNEKLQEIMSAEGVAPVLKLNPRGAKYNVYATEWLGILDRAPYVEEAAKATDEVNKYMGYQVKITVEALHPHKLPENPTFVLTGDDGQVIDDVSVERDNDGVGAVLTYEFDPIETHPKDTLRAYVEGDLIEKFTEDGGAAVDRNVASDGATRLYTRASWEAYKNIYFSTGDHDRNKVRWLLEHRKRYGQDELAAYETVLAGLREAVGNLAVAAETCECVIGELSGVDAGTEIELSMGEESSATLNLKTHEQLVPSVTGSRGEDVGPNGTACIKHKDTAEAEMDRYEYTLPEEGENTANATIENNVLTVTKSGYVKVKLTAFYGDQSKEVLFTVHATGTPATDEQKNALQDLINETKNKYPDYESNEELKAAIEAAEEALAEGKEPTVADIENAKDAINNAVQKIEDEANKEELLNNLNQAITAAGAYLDKENEYTADSWKIFTDAYAAATASDRDETKLAQLTKALNDAIAGLKKKDDGSGNNNNPNPPNPPGPGGQTPGPGQTPGGTPAPSDNFKDGLVQTVGGMSYKVTKAASLEVTLIKGKDAKTVKIPATVNVGGKTCKVVAIGGNAFKNCNKKLANVVIGKNVKSMKKNAFNNCKKLGKITFSGTTLPKMKKAFNKTKAKPTIKVNKKLRRNTAAKKKTLNQLKKAGLKKITIKSIK